MRAPRVLIAGSIGVATVALIGVASAIPDSDGRIHACYQLQSGLLRVVESSQECRTSEGALAWSVQGEQGEPGQPGPAGVSGYGIVSYEMTTPHADPGQYHFFTRHCPPGKKVLSGGFDFTEIPLRSATELPQIVRDDVTADGKAWELGLRFRVSSAPTTIAMRLACASAES